MASTFTTNLNLELQGTGDNSGTWGTVLNNAALAVIDQVLGGVQSISLAGGDVTVTTNQSQNNAIFLTGALPANRNLTFPAIGRTYFIVNNTTGAFTVTLRAGVPSTTVEIPQGASGYYTISGNNVYAPTLPAIPTGAIVPFGMTTAPTGWLACDGAAVSRTTYAALFSTIGTTFGSGDGSTTFNLPSTGGQFVRGWISGQVVDPARVFGSAQTEMIGPHTHVFVGTPLATHTHTFVAGDDGSSAGPHIGGGGYQGNELSRTTSATSGGTPAGTINNNSGTENRPVNIALMYCIKT